jgi:hypothetical protein
MLIAPLAVAQDRVDFNFDVKPILSDRCFFCHGPDAENRAADLRLDTKDGAFAASQTGDVSHVIKPGDISQSELLRRITSTDPDVVMPPPESNLSVSEDEAEVLKKWIQQGAEWKDHWSFIPLQKIVDVPKTDSVWPKNPIDNFVFDRLAREKLEPTKRADKQRLIRRVTFDLTGLPPTLAEIDAFIADESANAFEKVVDRLLASEAYGERMTSEWLDVARYSDTYGYQQDRDRFVWPWRDWVVNAFNKNMPYDEFATEQIAGDLIPEATQDQILATTFNRLHPQKVEGGSVPEEFRVEYVADRAQTFSTVFLGLTMECARCHDHKYDPLAQKEYYQLFAFFNNIDEAGLYSFFTPAVPTPTLLLPKDDAKTSLGELADKITKAEAAVQEAKANARAAFVEWKKADGKLKLQGEVAYLNCDKPSGPNKTVPGKLGQALKLTGDDPVNTKVGNFQRSQPFSVALWMNTPDVKERAVIFHRSRAWTDAGSRGYQLLLEDGKLSASLIHFWPGNAIRVRAKQPLAIEAWHHVAVTYDGSSRASGLKILVDGKPIQTEVVRDNLYKNITGGGGDNIAIGQRFRDNGFKGGLVDEFRVFDRELTMGEVRQLATDESATDAELLAYYCSVIDPKVKAARDELTSLRQQYCKVQNQTTEIMVMNELPKPRETFVLARGAYDAPAEKVSMDTPAVFPPMTKNASRNRLDLAKWLFSPEHPLTSRVIVNRYWQLLFGEGLVRTPEDFGSQGSLPTHPELLDWLARDLMDHDWDIKRFLKQIVMSATYQQDSTTTEDLLSRDPENLLLARFSSYRWPAEMVRDNALAVSELLVSKVGGPPAKPYEVEASFKPAKRDKGDGLYRRSLYTYWKRTGPAPVMMTLDASKRDVCRVKRERTSSPLQAFVVLNGPQFVEAARALGEKMLETHASDGSKMIDELFRRLTSRTASEVEMTLLLKLHASQLEAFKADPERAAAYLKSGDAPIGKATDSVQLAAITVVANTLLSLDESLMKR